MLKAIIIAGLLIVFSLIMTGFAAAEGGNDED